jgi:hypothetical protein
MCRVSAALVGSSSLDAGEECTDLLRQTRRMLRERLRSGQHLSCRSTCRLGTIANIADVQRDLICASGRLLNVAGNLLSCGSLLLHRS